MGMMIISCWAKAFLIR